MLILGIETSCDDTCVAIYDTKNGVLFNEIYNQELHKNYGGIVPELAARLHEKKIFFLINKAIKSTIKDFNKINAIAYTYGPGLFGSLLVGATVAKTLSYIYDIPNIEVNHLEAHLLVPMLYNKDLNFPFLSLIISGKNTQLVFVKKLGKYKILGCCLDDAIGEAFDKVAFWLGLGYPCGSKISKISKNGFSDSYNLPKPYLKGFSFSFSGIKTFMKNLIKNSPKDYQTKCNLAKSFEDTVFEVVMLKCIKALDFLSINKLVISGGVSANLNLRNKLSFIMKKRNGRLFFTKKNICTDNAIMIAYVGSIKLKKSENNSNINIFVDPKITLSNFYI
ncbi:MAG: tRNA (adenosine(37)-N6)-threonylcarbamoyltransferase complex transferase subunit TsaD [Enterobacteriaceae bacterium]